MQNVVTYRFFFKCYDLDKVIKPKNLNHFLKIKPLLLINIKKNFAKLKMFHQHYLRKLPSLSFFCDNSKKLFFVQLINELQITYKKNRNKSYV